jgi:hypothetical protein
MNRALHNAAVVSIFSVPLFIVGTVVAEFLSYLQYAGYCVESGHNVGCNVLIPNFPLVLTLEVFVEIGCIAIYILNEKS